MCKHIIPLLIFSLAVAGCNSGSLQDAIDTLDGVPRKTIDARRLGVNAFAADPRFGSASAQFAEVLATLKLGRARLLFAWDSGVHPAPSGAPSLAFVNGVVRSLPAGMDALPVLTGVPAWMSNSANWIDGNPRKTFVERWLRPVLQRHGANPRIVGFQIWNEPNAQRADNAVMGFSDPANYVEMLALAADLVRQLAPGKLVVSAATTAINQNYPDSLDYNRAMRDAGAQSFCDIWAIHYYGEQYERVIAPHGVADFLNGLDRPVWITETGNRGVNAQLAYGERTWPFLTEEIPGIDRIYIYQFAEDTPPDSTYGLRNLSANFALSDLYIWLRDRGA